MASDGAPGASAPSWRLPAMQVLTIEYPGAIGASAASLERALSSLAPLTSPTEHRPRASDALAHLTTFLARGGRIVECRLVPRVATPDDMYRHPILGDVVDASALAVRVRRQVWQRTHDGATVYRRRYLLELLGASHKTVRFRRMADFAFRPAARTPAIDIHRALSELDVAALRAFRFAPESEEYEVDSGGVPSSRLDMLPPPFFSRQELPFAYNYRQNPTSSLQHLSHAPVSKRRRPTARKGAEDATTAPVPPPEVAARFVNRARWRNMAPVAIKFADAAVPTQPDAQLADMPLTDRQKAQLEQLRTLFDTRPVWSRLALLNQLPADDAKALLQYVTSFHPGRRSFLRWWPTRLLTAPGVMRWCALDTTRARSARAGGTSASTCAARRRVCHRRAASCAPSMATRRRRRRRRRRRALRRMCWTARRPGSRRARSSYVTLPM